MKLGNHTHIRSAHRIIEISTFNGVDYFSGEGENRRPSINAAKRASRAMSPGAVRTADSLAAA